MHHHERTCDENTSNIGSGVAIYSENNINNNNNTNIDKPMSLVEQAHNGKLRVYRKEVNSSDIYTTLRETIMNECKHIIKSQHNHVKWYIGAKIIFQKATRPDMFTDPPIYLRTSPIATTTTTPWMIR